MRPPNIKQHLLLVILLFGSSIASGQQPASEDDDDEPMNDSASIPPTVDNDNIVDELAIQCQRYCHERKLVIVQCMLLKKYKK
jgi:hypothetical protein